MVEEKVIKCISSLLGNGVSLVEELRSEIKAVTEYLEKLCWSLDNLGKFLVHYEDHFMVDNGRVCVYNSHLDSGRNEAVDFYEAELEKEKERYGEWPNYENFYGHIGQANKDIQDYLHTFYSKEEFKKFLSEYPDVFVILGDDTVCLIELECVNYFKKCLENGGIPITALQCHSSYASNHIREFMYRYYGDSFVDFLEDNSDTFYAKDGNVYLK